MALGIIIVILLLMTGFIEFAAGHWAWRVLDPAHPASAFVATESVLAVLLPILLLVMVLRALRRARGLDIGQAILLGIGLLLLLLFAASLSIKELAISTAAPPPSPRLGQHM